jgi:hypothetical protein
MNNKVFTYKLDKIDQTTTKHVPTKTLHAHSASEQRCIQLNKDEKETQDECNSVVDLCPSVGVNWSVRVRVIVTVTRSGAYTVTYSSYP